MTILGIMMVFACFSYGIILINQPPLVLPWNRPECPRMNMEEDCTIFMRPEFGWSFYLVLITGIITVILALIVLIMDYFFPRLIAPVFHHSIVEDDEIFTVSLIV